MDKTSVSLLVLLLTSCILAAGKNNNVENSKYWLAAGIGKNYFGPTFSFSLAYSFNK